MPIYNPQIFHTQSFPSFLKTWLYNLNQLHCSTVIISSTTNLYIHTNMGNIIEVVDQGHINALMLLYLSFVQPGQYLPTTALSSQWPHPQSRRMDQLRAVNATACLACRSDLFFSIRAVYTKFVCATSLNSHAVATWLLQRCICSRAVAT